MAAHCGLEKTCICGDTVNYTEVTFKRKFGSDSQVADSSKTKKKPRTTEVTSNVKLQNLEVRLENLASPVVESPQSNVETNNDQQIEGRSRRRNKSQVSYKEPGLGKKLRQVIFIFVIRICVYWNFNTIFYSYRNSR